MHVRFFPLGAGDTRRRRNEHRIGHDDRLGAVVDGHADDVLVVTERVDRRGVVVRKVVPLPAGREDGAVEERRVGDNVGNLADAARAQRVDERLEHRVAVERVAPAEGWIAAAAEDDVLAVEPQLGREAVIESDAVGNRGRGEELAIRRRHQERAGVPRVERVSRFILDGDAPDGVHEGRAGGDGIEFFAERLRARRADQAKEKASNDGPCCRLSHAAGMIRAIPLRWATAWDLR